MGEKLQINIRGPRHGGVAEHDLNERKLVNYTMCLVFFLHHIEINNEIYMQFSRYKKKARV